MDDFLLLNPGPVPVPESIRSTMSEPMISHRSDAFAGTFAKAQDGLDYVFTHATLEGENTASGGETLLLNATATMGMEAAVANLISPGDQVVAIVNGKFGRRFARIAERYTDAVTQVEFSWGQPIDIDTVATALHDEVDLLTAVHTETSTGLRNPIGEIGELAHTHNIPYVIDGVSAIGGDEFFVDDWHVDIAITDAQKALGIPPGIAGVFISNTIKEEFDGEAAPFYEDLEWHLEKATIHQTPFTTAIPQIRALATAVEMIEEEGMSTRIERHHRQSAAYRTAFQSMGLELFPEPEGSSEYAKTMTAVELPEAAAGDNFEAFTEALADRHVSVAGGHAHLSGKIFRVSNMAWFDDDTILDGIGRIGDALLEVGADLDKESGLEAAQSQLF